MEHNSPSSPSMPTFHKGGGAHGRFKPGEKPKNAKGTLLRLMRIFMGWRKQIFSAAFLTVLSAAFSLLTPWLIGRAINTFRIGQSSVNTSLLDAILIPLTACYAAGWIIDTGNGVLMARVSQSLVTRMRTQLYAKFQKIPLYFYDTHPNGDLMSRVTNDVDNISGTISQTTTQMISSVFSIAGSTVMMLMLSPPLTAAAMTAIPLFLLLTKLIAGKSRNYFLGQQRELGLLNGIVEENIEGLKMVKAYGLQEQVTERFEAVNAEMKEDSVKAQIWSGFLMPFMNVINNFSYALLACFGGILTVRGTVTVGVIVSFLTYSRQFGQPLNNIAGMFNSIQSALAGAERIFQILDEAEEQSDAPDAAEVKKPEGRVEFRDVSFAYPGGKPVLRHVSFLVQPGEVVALVGETGAGKTTIVNLLTRFYERSEGEIRVDGVDIAKIRRSDLRNFFSIVLQDTCLFTGTIADNIRYSRPSASEEEVVGAAKMARADPFISRLPRKYETPVSGGSVTLSQGQRQLLAIARAVLCDAPILILDEATSSVDTRTEKEIQRAMLALMKNRTCFLIAHRLSTIRDVDRIMVIGDGKIQECGTHRELMNQKGRYYRMVKSQTGGDSLPQSES